MVNLVAWADLLIIWVTCNILLMWQPLYGNVFILRRPAIANFANIIKILTIIKKNLLRIKKGYKNWILCVQIQSMSVFLGIAKFADFRVKNTFSRTQVVCQVIYPYSALLWAMYNCVKRHYCRICKTYFREGSLFGPPNLWVAPTKRPIVSKFKVKIV